MQVYLAKLKTINIPSLVRLSNDAWGVVLLVAMISFLQYAITQVVDATQLLQYCLTITLLTILIIGFFSNSDRDTSRFATSNILFFAFLVGFATSTSDFKTVFLLIAFFCLLWVYFLLCMKFPEKEENTVNLTYLLLVALIQLVLYASMAIFAVGLPGL